MCFFWPRCWGTVEIHAFPYISGLPPPRPKKHSSDGYWKPLKILGKLTIPLFGADARTARLGRPPAGDAGFFGKPIEIYWKTMYFLQPRPARAPSGPGPLRRHLGKMTVIRKPSKTFAKPIISRSAPDAQTATLGSPSAGDIGFFGKLIENHWDSLCFLQPRSIRC